MQIERGVLGTLPYAATGSGPPLLLLAGLSPTTGVDSDRFVRGTLAPVRSLAGHRRLIVVNRRARLPTGLTMAQLATEHADAIRSGLDSPVDVVGVSTGGSIAQQLAADHPDTVGRLILLSTACRLGPIGRTVQNLIAAELRGGRTRRAVSVAAADLAPAGVRAPARALGWVAARRIITSPGAAADLAITIEAEDGFDLARCVRPIVARTLILAGARDNFYGSALFEETAALIPNSRLQIFGKRGHIGVLQDRRTMGMIAGFLT